MVSMSLELCFESAMYQCVCSSQNSSSYQRKNQMSYFNCCWNQNPSGHVGTEFRICSHPSSHDIDLISFPVSAMLSSSSTSMNKTLTLDEEAKIAVNQCDIIIDAGQWFLSEMDQILW